MFIITVYFTASAREVPEARSHSPSLIRSLLGVLQRVSRVSVHTVYETPCLCSVGFFHRADKGSALRDQRRQRVVDLRAALRAIFSESLYRLHRNRILFGPTSV